LGAVPNSTLAIGAAPKSVTTLIQFTKSEWQPSALCGPRQLRGQRLKDGWMHGFLKLHPSGEVFCPPTTSFQQFQPFKLNPNRLSEIWALDELKFATLGGQVEHAHTVIALSWAPQHHLCGQTNASTLPNVHCRIRHSRGHFAGKIRPLGILDASGFFRQTV
jgi:hypothetical protein